MPGRYATSQQRNGMPSFLHTPPEIFRRYPIMACFLVPAAEAVITTVAAKVIKSKEKENAAKLSVSDNSVEETKNPVFHQTRLAQ